MNTLLKSVLLTGSLLWGASASAATVDGITWNGDSFLDFDMQQSIFENDVDAVGDVLTVYGLVSLINGSDYHAGAQELTFFGTFVVSDTGDFDGDGKIDVLFNNGVVNFFADQGNAEPGNVGAFDASNSATATDGLLWLTIQGHDTDKLLGAALKNAELFAELNSGFVFGNTGDTGAGSGAFDVTGGSAAAYLDTNRITAIDSQLLSNGPADLSFSTSFQPSTQNSEVLIATAHLVGRTVPEPATLSILGIGMLALRAFSGRRKHA